MPYSSCQVAQLGKANAVAGRGGEGDPHSPHDAHVVGPPLLLYVHAATRGPAGIRPAVGPRSSRAGSVSSALPARVVWGTTARRQLLPRWAGSHSRVATEAPDVDGSCWASLASRPRPNHPSVLKGSNQTKAHQTTTTSSRFFSSKRMENAHRDKAVFFPGLGDVIYVRLVCSWSHRPLYFSWFRAGFSSAGSKIGGVSTWGRCFSQATPASYLSDG